MTINEEIVELKKLRKQNKDTSELTNHLVEELAVCAYFLPQTRLQMEEEDASEFVLTIIPMLEKIIDTFDIEKGDFMSFFFSVIRNKVRTFYKRKRLSLLTEECIIEGHCVYEYILSQDNNNPMQLIVAEESDFADNSFINRLRYIFERNKSAQKRFFVLFASIFLYLSVDDLARLCTHLNYDFAGAYEVYEQLYERKKKLIAQEEIEKEKRNVHWTRHLLYQLFSDMTPEVESYWKLSEYHRDQAEKPGNEPLRVAKHIDYNTLSDVLHRSKGTIASDAFYSRNLIAWCNSDDFDDGNANWKRISDDTLIAQKILQASAEMNPEIEETNTKPFNPVEEFKLKVMVK